ncbi:MAG: YraN family protein [Candidatus Levybacteria bacterium]|nr:YraN family protein [Candidatus Levybacteria bacterium]
MKVSNPTAKRGEDIAAEYLKKKGYKIIERNFRGRNGEIDIIAIDGSEKDKALVFVEVKTRNSVNFGTPLEAINYFKLKSLIHVAQFYKVSHRNLPELLRIDAVAVKLSDDNAIDIEHVKNISDF